LQQIKRKKSFYFSWIETFTNCRIKTRHRSTQIDQCKRTFSTSVESQCSPIDRIETQFQFWLCG
jgi:hypothetical protein